MATRTSCRLTERLSELERTVDTLTLRVNDLQRRVADSSHVSRRRSYLWAWIRKVVFTLSSHRCRRGHVRENRRMDRHVIAATRQSCAQS